MEIRIRQEYSTDIWQVPPWEHKNIYPELVSDFENKLRGKKKSFLNSDTSGGTRNSTSKKKNQPFFFLRGQKEERRKATRLCLSCFSSPTAHSTDACLACRITTAVVQLPSYAKSRRKYLTKISAKDCMWPQAMYMAYLTLSSRILKRD